MTIYGLTLKMRGGGEMNMLEEIASIVMRIRELRARIECSEDRSITWLEQVELAELRERLESMKNDLIKTKEA